jgi:aminopeptidase N
MIKGMKDALAFCSEHFGVYKHEVLRIVEVPRYKDLTNSYATIIPFSEGTDFLLKEGNPDKDPNIGYYVTAHEVAHQWWGQQLMPANLLGNTMISEGLAQYTALMVMKRTFSVERMKQFLNYELDNYLKGRAQEKEVENTLTRVDDQKYINRHKGALAFYSLQDYVGEGPMDSVFKKFYGEWSLRGGLYPSSRDLMNFINRVTPDSLHYLVHDLFESVTLFENKTLDAVYREEKEGKYEVTLSVSCDKKTLVNASGDQRRALPEWIDVGVYTLDSQGHQKLVYLKKHLIKKKFTNIVVTVNSKPFRAGIDPLHMLPDRYSEDNVIAVKEYINITNLPVDLEQ